MGKKLKVLALHGVGGHEIEGKWEERWSQAIDESLTRISSSVETQLSFLHYDDIFDAQSITASGTFEAVAKLGASGLCHGIGDVLGGVFSRPRARGRAAGPKSIPDRLRWTAGMVVQWAEDESIRKLSRKRLAQKIRSVEPDVILAHSLGSLIAYDTFVRSANAELVAGRTFITFGSQIGNPFVRSQFAGRIVPLPCEHWYHLFNEEDDVFTAPIRLAADNFEQVDCLFDIAGFADHDACKYLGHANVSAVVWHELLSSARFRQVSRSARVDISVRGRPLGQARSGSTQQHRALLVGINNYPNPEERLEGCVNDVFLMSEVLQESGFDASQIRTLLDERATADGIRSRLEWLLDDAQDGDQRFLYFSGHGSQIMDYGPDETIDRLDECLVPWDFDWTRENAIVDDWFYDLYSQLPYESRLIVVFDCCHSGGMTRTGMGRPKGLVPRDDIRHRELRWNATEHIWEPRELESPNRSLATGKMGKSYLGKSGVKRRLGRATNLLTMEDRAYNAARKRFGHHGPYLPVIIQACQEDELAYEYRHGVTSYGAFTFALAQELRSAEARAGMSMDALYEQVRQRLRKMRYEQQPNIVGPSIVTQQPVQWCQDRG
jgi:metacaspase-1